MDERIDLFWTTAQGFVDPNGKRSKWKSEVAKLRKFFFRNQSARLAELPQQRLLDTVRLYVQLFPAEEDVLLLVKDALAMPFGVVGTKHKKRLLKLHEQLLGSSGENGGEPTPAPVERTYSCVGMDADGYLSLLDDESGDMIESLQVQKKTPEWRTIKKHVDDGNVRVRVLDDEIVAVEIEDDAA
ncbi:hypothetical protein SDRG_02735 [Saprolegnia diclina VS20]|uniref:Translation elongation factor IF5A C-terminal domain-containing protein n=1 Tax=Saprolegnia diclina (strain VS20) TaxID=1156394 RepID=T0R198_SAPDV|nr:hypothetical protein SDRG_02735 [Saprolegnia diclina VS20]EQC40080.1 hypothetical protein SDRG_02735 [Saprolegnia diclina VS20]|eukprot:XP_008606554.1 hypothetical protein SDRG_02735 [Saprolegnia diclina VS20]